MSKDTSGPAFPCTIHNKGDVTLDGFQNDTIEPGMMVSYRGATLREYAAMRAMQGMFAKHGYGDVDYVVRRAVKAADALLAELEK